MSFEEEHRRTFAALDPKSTLVTKTCSLGLLVKYDSTVSVSYTREIEHQ